CRHESATTLTAVDGWVAGKPGRQIPLRRVTFSRVLRPTQERGPVMNHRKTVVAALLLCGIGVALVSGRIGHSTIANHRATPHLSLQSCNLPDITGEARCGTYEVFEDRATRSGRTIKLKIIVLKALSKAPAPDAIFFLHGGPGAAATGSVELAQRGILEP